MGRSPAGVKGSLLQYSGLENSMDCTVHRVTKGQTRRSDSHLASASCPSTPQCVREYFQQTMTLSCISTMQHPNQEVRIAATLTANPETLFGFPRLSQQHLFPFWSKIQLRITVSCSCHIALSPSLWTSSLLMSPCLRPLLSPGEGPGTGTEARQYSFWLLFDSECWYYIY